MIIIKPFNLPQFIVFMVVFSAVNQTLAAAPGQDKTQKTPWYEVEIIVFANRDHQDINSESWPENPRPINYPQIVNLIFPGRANSTNKIMATPSNQGTSPPIRFDVLGNPIVENSAAQKPFSTGISRNLYSDGGYTFIRRGKLQLIDVYNKLASSKKYEPLLHVAWRQPTVNKNNALPVFLYEGMTIPDNIWLKTIRAQQGRTPISKTQITPFTDRIGGAFGSTHYATSADTNYGPQLIRLSGTVRLSVSRYLHIETDLHLRVPVIIQEEVIEPPMDSEQDISGADFGSFFGNKPQPMSSVTEREVIRDFTLSESRRMRSTEVHHLDHPLFALIVLVTPYELPIEEPAVEAIPIELGTPSR